MFRSGAFVAEQCDPVRPSQIQPNGLDLTLDAVFEQTEPGRIERGGKRIGDRRRVAALDGLDEESESEPRSDGDHGPDESLYRLSPGTYVVRYEQTIRVPEEHVGFVYPRSSLLRNSAMLNTAVWDAGYEGRGEGLLQVGHELELEAGVRIAQLVFARADHEGTYDGDYQGENVE
ncbi:deoxyuridine 5'-triphosphate nucleotidohydrolase [Halomarina oriensis]|uniref:Deoxyuridine 5'-triphosphate nucleotidohydrolase n=1 Tax=Halomarina oriensis TaxID=671145 RepID=A0A6B0GPL0_9EURY|nr:deoxyuridine 5'-triphosphate nucleotidohydrolase [Halomarina oriensis]MWG36660.1 deoxyuridine 5'-triphosphate nucleotidohydrolase [Halomarina oriensis]